MSAVAKPLPAWMSAISGFTVKAFTIVQIEAQKLRRDPTELLSRAVQPALWLLVFGQVLGHARAIPTGNVPYIDFMAPGILAQSVLFVAIFYGLSVIWERDLGILQKFLVSPTPRAALVSGKALSAGIRGIAQGIIVYLLALSLGVQMNWHPLAILGTALGIVLGAAVFSTFSLIIACIVKSRERFMGIGQVLTMPLFFASNAIYPVSMMPPWLQVISRSNPLTYQVDLLRTLMLAHGQSSIGIGKDILVLVASTLILIVIAAAMYPRLAR
jgi:ABC-2 type transport system permease protein